MSTPHDEAIKHVKWIAYGVVAPVIMGSGLVGNTLNLVVLTRPHLRGGVMYRYLLALAVANLLALLHSIALLMDVLDIYSERSYAGAFFRAHLELPLINCFSATSVFLIIEMTVERYLSVARPTRFPHRHNLASAHRYIAAAFLAGVVLNTPLCWYRKVVSISNGTDTWQMWGVMDNEQVTEQQWWKAYLWVSESLMRFLPLVSLIVLNALILSHFRSVTERRRRLREGCATPPSAPQDSASSSDCSVPGLPQPQKSPVHTVSASIPMTSLAGLASRASSTHSSTSSRRPSRWKQSPEERRLLRIMLGIIALFISCTTPAAFLSILYTENMEDDLGFQIFRATSNDLELLSFAANFYVYCLCSAEIRSTFVSVMQCRKWTKPR